MTINFEQCSLPGKKSGKCDCGVRRTRRTTITHTINPFNVNTEGIQKSREEVYADVRKEVQTWESEPIYCDNCRPPTYWELSDQEQDEYNQKGKVTTKTMNGKPYLMIKPQRRKLNIR